MPLRGLSWVQLGHSSTGRCHLFGPSLIPGQSLTPDRGAYQGLSVGRSGCPILLGNYYVQPAIFAVFVLPAVFRRKQRGAWIFAFLSGWAGFPGALYLSLAKVGHERMSRNSRTKLGHHKFNSPETSLCGNAATKSTRKVLKSSPWARHSSMVRPGHIGVPDTWVTLLAQKGCRELAGFFPPGRCSQWSGPETWVTQRTLYVPETSFTERS